MAVTKMNEHDIPEDPFLAYTKPPDNCTNIFKSFKINDTLKLYALPALTDDLINENCTDAGTYDYFSNSEVSYILSFTFIGAFIVGKMFLLRLLKQKC